MSDFTELSKQQWDGRGTVENINAGSLQRIAAATETMAASSAIMAKNYVQLQNDLDWYKRHYAEDRKTIKNLENSRAAYKAHATRLRNKLAEINTEVVR